MTVATHNSDWWHYTAGAVQFTADLISGALEPWGLPPARPEAVAMAAWSVRRRAYCLRLLLDQAKAGCSSSSGLMPRTQPTAVRTRQASSSGTQTSSSTSLRHWVTGLASGCIAARQGRGSP